MILLFCRGFPVLSRVRCPGFEMKLEPANQRFSLAVVLGRIYAPARAPLVSQVGFGRLCLRTGAPWLALLCRRAQAVDAS